jgi:hypothetical protein
LVAASASILAWTSSGGRTEVQIELFDLLVMPEAGSSGLQVHLKGVHMWVMHHFVQAIQGVVEAQKCLHDQPLVLDRSFRQGVLFCSGFVLKPSCFLDDSSYFQLDRKSNTNESPTASVIL